MYHSRSTGNVYIADTDNDRIRFVSASKGIISTIAGGDYTGDGGAATSAVLNGNFGVTVDSSGSALASILLRIMLEV